MSDLENIINGEQPETEAAEPPVEQEAAPEPAESVEAAEPAEPEKETEPVTAAEPEKAEEPQTVPVGVVQELRRELRELKAAQNKPQPAPVPDVFEDPQGYQAYMQDAVRSGVTSTKLEMSRFMAEKEFGAETVEAAYEYFNAHPEQSAALLSHPSPFHAAVEYYNQQRVAQEIGSDPAAYAAKLEADLRAKIEAEMVAKQARDAAGKFAPSMANVTGTGGGPKTNWTGPAPLSSVLGE